MRAPPTEVAIGADFQAAGRGRDWRLLAAAVAAALGGAGARAEDCGKNGEGFSQWLNSFKQVAQGNGVSAGAVDAALDGVSYDPAVKRHDGGVAMFGHNFAGFAASHVTPGMVARGKAELKRYAGAAGHDRAALRRARAGAGGDLGPGNQLRRRQRLVSDLQRARNAAPGIAAAPSGIAPN